MHVEIARRAQKFLKRLQKEQRARIEKRLRQLAQNPVPADAKFLGRDQQAERVFRYRIGPFRALYKLKKECVLVAKIDKRPRVYRR